MQEERGVIMANRSKSVYDKSMNLEGEITISLNADERMMICESLVKVAPNECDIIPLMFLCDRIVKGK
jgi:hypothetical protein